jgi:30S ribosomal protein S31
MGKGDKRTRRGKIFAGSFGKTRQKHKAATFVATEKPVVAAEKPAPKKRVAKRVPAAAAPAEAPVAEAPAEQTVPAAEETTAPAAEETATPEAPAPAAEAPTVEESQPEADTAQA